MTAGRSMLLSALMPSRKPIFKETTLVKDFVAPRSSKWTKRINNNIKIPIFVVPLTTNRKLISQGAHKDSRMDRIGYASISNKVMSLFGKTQMISGMIIEQTHTGR